MKNYTCYSYQNYAMKKIFVGLIFLSVITYSVFAQQYRPNTEPNISNEEMYELLMYKSRKQKTAAWISLAGGPVITAAGLIISVKNNSSSVFYGDVNPNKSVDFGRIIAAVGVVSTLASIPLFLSASKYKQKAKLLLKNESTSFQIK